MGYFCCGQLQAGPSFARVATWAINKQIHKTQRQKTKQSVHFSLSNLEMSVFSLLLTSEEEKSYNCIDCCFTKTQLKKIVTVSFPHSSVICIYRMFSWFCLFLKLCFYSLIFGLRRSHAFYHLFYSKFYRHVAESYSPLVQKSVTSKCANIWASGMKGAIMWLPRMCFYCKYCGNRGLKESIKLGLCILRVLRFWNSSIHRSVPTDIHKHHRPD